MKKLYFLFFSLFILISCKKGSDPAPPDPGPAPTITKVNPLYGLYNKAVVIEGTHFSTVAADNLVKFNGREATIEIAETNSLVVRVPLDCGTGKVTVTVNGQTATGPVFNYIGGEVITWAGDGSAAIKNGPALSAGFAVPLHLARDKVGNMYVTEGSWAIRKISADGQVTFFAGNADSLDHKDGAGADARFMKPLGIVCDADGNLYVADLNTIRKITPQGVVSTYAGNAQQSGYVDGNVTQARFGYVTDIAIDKNGNLYVCDALRIRKISKDGIVSTFAGSGESGYADGPALTAKFYTLENLSADDNGNVYVPDSWSERIRKITPDGNVSTLAGSGDNSFKDAQGILADFSDPWNVAADKSGNVYVTDNHGLVRKIYPDGNVVTIAGIPEQRGYIDGALYESKFYNPSDIEIEDNGDLYIADGYNNVIRKIVFK